MTAEAGEVAGGTRPRPWVAAVLSLWVPGLGHLYAGRPVVCLVALIGMPVVYALTVPGMFVLPGPLLLLPLPVPLVLWLGVAVHAWATARRAPATVRSPRWRRWPFYVALGLGGALVYGNVDAVFRADLARTFHISSVSMAPTFLPGDYVLADRREGEAERGGLVIYRRPGEPADALLYVGRVVGVGGDVVAMRDGVLQVDGSPVDEPYVQESEPADEPHPLMEWQARHLVDADSAARADYRPTPRTWGPLRVPEGTVLVLGDHRDQSADSRYVGPVPLENVMGHPRRVYFSVDPEDGVRWERVGARPR